MPEKSDNDLPITPPSNPVIGVRYDGDKCARLSCSALELAASLAQVADHLETCVHSTAPATELPTPKEIQEYIDVIQPAMLEFLDQLSDLDAALKPRFGTRSLLAAMRRAGGRAALGEALHRAVHVVRTNKIDRQALTLLAGMQYDHDTITEGITLLRTGSAAVSDLTFDTPKLSPTGAAVASAPSGKASSETSPDQDLLPARKC